MVKQWTDRSQSLFERPEQKTGTDVDNESGKRGWEGEIFLHSPPRYSHHCKIPLLSFIELHSNHSPSIK
jgi:hypothetical protein